jgi:hypothetical protein
MVEPLPAALPRSAPEAAPDHAGSDNVGSDHVGPDNAGSGGAWPQLPTETDIYILPDGRVVIADLPAELTALAAALGAVEPCEIAPDAQPDPTL